jgi:hypothetical protein
MALFNISHQLREIIPVINHYDYLAYLRLGTTVSKKMFKNVSLEFRNIGDVDAPIQIQILNNVSANANPDKLHDAESSIALDDSGADQRNTVSTDVNEELLENYTFEDPADLALSGGVLTTLADGGLNSRKSFTIRPGGVVGARFTTVGSLVLIRREIPVGSPATTDELITRLLVTGRCNSEISLHLMDSEKDRFRDSTVKFS